MLHKRNLLICLAAVAFCLVGIESAEACDDWYFDDYDMWMFFLWDCSEYSWPLDETQSTLFLDSHVGFEVNPFCGIEPDMGLPTTAGGTMIPVRRADALIAVAHGIIDML